MTASPGGQEKGLLPGTCSLCGTQGWTMLWGNWPSRAVHTDTIADAHQAAGRGLPEMQGRFWGAHPGDRHRKAPGSREPAQQGSETQRSDGSARGALRRKSTFQGGQSCWKERGSHPGGLLLLQKESWGPSSKAPNLTGPKHHSQHLRTCLAHPSRRQPHSTEDSGQKAGARLGSLSPSTSSPTALRV